MELITPRHVSILESDASRDSHGLMEIHGLLPSKLDNCVHDGPVVR